MRGLHGVFERVAERRGGWAWLGWLLLPLSLLFRCVAVLRRAVYEAELLPVTRLKQVVVSVGNIEVGGTGKTPVTVWLARRLAGRGLSVAVVARDLRRRRGGPRRVRSGSSGGRRPGDEVLLLARKLGDTCAVYAGPHKRDCAVRAARELDPDVILVDDGFQHLKLGRDVDVVVAAFQHPLGRGGLLPSGSLREPPSALSRAHWLWVTGVPPGRSSGWARRLLSQHNWKAGQVESSTVASGFLDREGRAASPEGGPALAFCGIGRPEGFMETLERTGLDVVDRVVYPDHHGYTGRDMEQLRSRASESGAELLVTTEKDMVKVAAMPEAPEALLALSVTLEVDGARRLLGEIVELAARRRAESGG
ncbi:MAG: tetraacyldisaccharide 4'-kinase [Candidatus Fermentibacteraceae bacterium]